MNVNDLNKSNNFPQDYQNKSELKTVKFEFNGSELNALVNPQNDVFFIASEICAELELNNVTKALYGLDDDEKLTLPLVRSGQIRNVNVLTESGFYTLILRSNKPQAKPLKDKVTKEILPSIRKTGSYTSNKPQSLSQMFLQQAQINVEFEERINTIDRKLEVLEAKTTNRVDYFSIVAYANLNKIRITSIQALSLGKKASKLCVEMGYQMDYLPDGRWGKVNAYPEEVLQVVFNEIAA